jgi:NAD(P)H dehydrogenase (quinone)
MKSVLIAYFSISGKTERMAEYIAEGIRFNDARAVVRKMVDIKDPEELIDYDGYIFGSPTISLDIPKPVKKFLFMIKEVDLEGKLGGAFGSYAHDVSYGHDYHAARLISDILQNEHKMRSFDLGQLSLKENVVDTREGIKACHDYGRIFGAEISQLALFKA